MPMSTTIVTTDCTTSRSPIHSISATLVGLSPSAITFARTITATMMTADTTIITLACTTTTTTTNITTFGCVITTTRIDSSCAKHNLNLPDELSPVSAGLYFL